MSRVLYLGFPGEGHVNPSLGLVRELIRRGEEVHYFCTEEYKEKIESSGARFRLMKNILGRQDQRNDNQLLENKSASFFSELKVQGLRLIIETVSDILSQIKGETIDYVIFDTHFIVGKIVAQYIGMPNISFCTTFGWTEGSPSILGNIGLTMQATEPNSVLEKEADALMAQLKEEYGFIVPDFPEFIFSRGDITLVCTSKYFQPGVKHFDETYKFIGPIISSRNDTGDFPIDRIKNQRTVYIAMGTIVNEQKELYNQCIEALADFDGVVVMSIGKKIDIHDLQEIPDHFIVRNYVPQLEVLQHTDVFITHCGMNSTNEALYHNVPLVMYPITNDQPLVAKRVQLLGAGIILDKSELYPIGLRQAVEKVLADQTYKENATKIGASLRESGGYRQGVNEIFALLEEFSFIKK